MSFDCDFSNDALAIPELVNALSSYPVKACFACVGKLIEKYPREHALLVERGHEIVNHSYTHPNNEVLNPNVRFNELSLEEQKNEIIRCDRAINDITGYRPTGFRTPHFGELHTDSVYDALREAGYSYSSSTTAIYSQTGGMPYMAKGIVEFPLSSCPKHPFTAFDSWHSLSRGGSHHPGNEFIGLYEKIADIAAETGSYVNLYFDPQDIIRDGIIDKMLEVTAGKSVEVVTYRGFIEKYNGAILR